MCRVAGNEARTDGGMQMRKRRQQQPSGSAAERLKLPPMFNIILYLTLALRTEVSGIWVME